MNLNLYAASSSCLKTHALSPSTNSKDAACSQSCQTTTFACNVTTLWEISFASQSRVRTFAMQAPVKRANHVNVAALREDFFLASACSGRENLCLSHQEHSAPDLHQSCSTYTSWQTLHGPHVSKTGPRLDPLCWRQTGASWLAGHLSAESWRGTQALCSCCHKSKGKFK